MRKSFTILLALFLVSVFLISTAPVSFGTAEAEISGITVEIHNTTKNDTALEQYRHTIVVAQLSGSGDLNGRNIYLNISGAITIHSTGTSDSNGTAMWEWIPEAQGLVYINASYNITVFQNVTRWIHAPEDVILEIEHPQTVQLGHRYYFQLFSLSKVGYFDPSYAPYRIRIYRHESNDTHTQLCEWVGFLDSHGYKGFYVEIDDTYFDPNINYEIWCYIYNNSYEGEEPDCLIDSDGGKTLGRATEFETGNYVSFLSAYGPSTYLWWYGATADQYDINDDGDEPLNWTHTVLGTIQLVNKAPPTEIPCDIQLATATNYNLIFFNDSNGNGVWDNDTDGEGEDEYSEDIWLDNGNGVWDDGTGEGAYPNEEYNGTPFLRTFHSFKVNYGLGEDSTLTISANKWTWSGYLNSTARTGKSLYENITNCSYVVWQNATGYYYTYGPGITQDFTVTYGSAICILTTTAETWNRK